MLSNPVELPADANKGNGKKLARLPYLSTRLRPLDKEKNKGGKDLPPRNQLKEKVSRYLPGVD